MRIIRVLISVGILCAGLCGAGPGCVWAGPQSGTGRLPRGAPDCELDFRLRTGDTPVSARVIMDWPGIRTGIAVEYGREGPRLLSGGIDTGWMTAGTLARKGLFREANDPGGYAAGSEVFLESDRYTLDRGFDRAGRMGLILSVPLGRGSRVFCVYDDPDGLSAGILVVLPLAGLLTLSVLTQGVLLPRPEINANSWFFEELDEPGIPAAGHGAAKMSLAHGVFRVSVCGGLSVAESLLPGGFIRVLAGLRHSRFTVRAVGTLVNETYLGLDGKFPDHISSFGACGSITPFKPLCLEAEYTRSLSRPAPVPASYVSSRDELACRLKFEMNRFKIGGEWGRKFTVSPDGGYSGGDTFRGEAGFKGTAVEGVVTGKLFMSPYQETSYACGAELAVEAGRWSFEARGDFTFEVEAALEAVLTVGFDTGTHAVEVVGEVEIEDIGAVSGGPAATWEIKAGYKFRMSRAVSK